MTHQPLFAVKQEEFWIETPCQPTRPPLPWPLIRDDRLAVRLFDCQFVRQWVLVVFGHRFVFQQSPSHVHR
jgi:hypothetical protein